MFTRREKLLRQQIAEPTRGLDRPRTLDAVEEVGPRHELSNLSGSRVDQPLGEHHFTFVDRDRRVRGLVGIDTDHHHLEILQSERVGDRGGHS